MEDPLDPLVAEVVEQLDRDLQEDFQERAAIVEYDAGLDRAHAECIALIAVLVRNPDALCRIRVVQVERGGLVYWLVTTSADVARDHLSKTDGTAMKAAELADAVDDDFGGAVMMAAMR